MGIIEDLRYSLRALARAPLFTTSVIVTLAIGIGANAAVFSVLDAQILQSLPYANPDQLTAIVYRSPQDRNAGPVPSPAFLTWKASSQTLGPIAAYSTGQMGWLLRSGEPIRVSVAFISSDFFDVLGVSAVERGRPLEPGDQSGGAGAVVVISERLWKVRLGHSSDVVGQTIRLNGRPYVIVGITRGEFRFPDSVTPDIFLPLALQPNSQVVRSVSVIGRLRSDDTIKQAQQELSVLTKEAAPTFPAAMAALVARGARPEVVPLSRRLVGDLRPVLLLAAAAVAVVLLTACGNVAGLLLARGAARDREFRTRLALGATPRALARLVFTETAILAALSGVATFALLRWAMGLLRVALAQTVPHSETITVSGRLAMFLGLTVVLTSITCAAMPMARLVRSGARTRNGRAATDRGMRPWFVAGQVAISFVLLLTGLLLLQTLWRLESVHLGFDPTGVWTFRIPAFTLRAPLANTQDGILSRIQQLPGVISAGATTAFPLDGHTFGFTVPVADQPPPPLEAHDGTRVDAVSPGYFRTMRIRVVEGRDFDQHDAAEAPPVAVVNQAFVRSILIGPRTLGRRIGLGGRPEDATITIVGVVDDVKDGNPGDPVPAIVYRPFAQAAPQMGWPTANVVIRTAAAPTGIAASVRDAVRAVAPTGTVYDEMTMDSRFARVLAPQRQRAALFGLFAAAAVLLALIGLYGLLNYSVTRELPEFGIRLALGARPQNLFVQVLCRGAVPTILGMVFGVLLARSVATLFARMLYDVTPSDSLTYATAAGLMLVASVLASVLPARRAAQADPLTLLKLD